MSSRSVAEEFFFFVERSYLSHLVNFFLIVSVDSLLKLTGRWWKVDQSFGWMAFYTEFNMIMNWKYSWNTYVSIQELLKVGIQNSFLIKKWNCGILLALLLTTGFIFTNDLFLVEYIIYFNLHIWLVFQGLIMKAKLQI